MTKQGLEQAIKNGESVWVVDLKNKIITENKRHKHFKKLLATQREYRIPFNRMFTTRRQAEHYLHHANITRTEQLPFLTWEEFNKDTLGFDFTDNMGNKYRCHIVRDYRGGEDFIVLYDKNGTISVDEEWELTEANFYKAYDECVRLFRGE